MSEIKVYQLDDVAALKTINDFIRWAASRFSEAQLFYGHGTDNAIDEALTIVLSILYLQHGTPESLLAANVTEDEKQRLLNAINTRLNDRKPAAYITRESWFAGLPFYVDERVLIPRSPIAELIERQFEPWVDSEQVNSILEIGAGSACIAIASALYFPNAHVTAVDISKEALAVAEINVNRHHCEGHVTLVESDLFTALDDDQRFDIIVSNPPYVSEEEYHDLPPEYRCEPALGLLAEDEGLAIIERILSQASDYLTPEGIIVVELGNGQGALIDRYPDVPFVWLDFERGGSGVFLLRREDLTAFEERG